MLFGKVYDTLSLEDGMVLYKKRIYILDATDLKLTVTKKCYDAKVAGHFGIEKTRELITRCYYWPDLEKWVRNYDQIYNACQCNQTARHKKCGALKPLDIPYLQ